MAFHIAEQRVNKINEPLLVIGLGGTGTDALLNVMDKFKRRFNLPVINGQEQDAPARTAYLSVDTDSTVLTQKKCGNTVLNPNEFYDISLSTIADLLDPKRSRSLLKSYELEWMDQDLQSLNAAYGAGGVRQCGRFMLCQKTDQLVNKLGTLIQGLMAVTAGADGGESITIVVMAGLGGGTGSGTFLDMAYLIRYVMASRFKGIKLTLMGFLVLPDVNLSHAGYADANKKVLRTNGFAALKELDFWMNFDQHHYAYTHQYSQNVSVKWEQPFNDVVLLSEKNEDGVVIDKAYEVVMDTMSEALMHFMADERNHSTDGFTYQSHKVNVQGAMAHLERSYPVNYCYMAIGAASTESQQNGMVVYEAKLTFDSLQALSKNESLLESRFPDTFHKAVILETEDPYMLFDAVDPLPGYFNGEPGYTYPEVRQMEGDGALHADPFNAFMRNARLNVITFAKEYQERVWGRFRDQSIAAIKNPHQGPFRFEEYLRDPANGFLNKLEQWKQYWQAETDNLISTVASQRSHVDGTLYPAMMNVSALERLLTERKAKDYISAVQVLYINARNQVVAEKMLEVYKNLLDRARNYTSLNLATFNRMVLTIRASLSEEVTQMQNRPALFDTQMISFERLRQYVDTEFAKLKGGLTATTEQVLGQMAEMSFSLQIDGSTNRVAEVEAKQREFSELVEGFVSETFRKINRVKLDDVLDMTMPDANENERINFVATSLLPKLRNSARTMYQTHAAMRSLTNSYIDYSYVSVPYDAEIMKQGLKRYRDSGEPITPKESEITDRLYWLKTYNCLPLCRFAMLTTLEDDYEASLANPNVHGVHLVYNTENESRRDRIRGTWKVMPSPVPHLLLGEPLSKRQDAQLKRLQATMDKAFTLGVVKLTDATPDGVDVYLKMDENGLLMEDETFCDRIRTIMDNVKTSNTAKREALEALNRGLTPIHITYLNYINAFAKSLNLKVVPDVNNESSRLEAEANREKVRRYIAGFMITLKPELLEQIEGQLHMFDELQTALDKIYDEDRSFEKMLEYASRLAIMLFVGMIRQGFGAFKFDMPDHPDELLFSTGQIKTEELGLPPVLALLNALANKDDDRIAPMKRRYLEEQATKKLARLDQLSEAEQQEFLQRARDFVEKNESKPQQIKYDDSITEEQRDKQSRLLQQMVKTAQSSQNM